ncbi:hypothetical protein SALBM311S_10576 [Streptomyces alboniger]
MALDAEAGTGGAFVQVWDSSGGADQHWYFR